MRRRGLRVDLAQRPDGSLFTFTTWPDAVGTLLPIVDVVGFAGRDGVPPIAVPWPMVAREAGLVVDRLYDPPRFHVTAWPPESTMDRLRGDAVSP